MKFFFVLIQKILSKTLGLVLTRKMMSLDEPHSLDVFTKLDYVRLAALDLVAKEINQKQIAGSIAELGVYQGEFAYRMNSLFPQKKLYLFDTFEGFDKRDMEVELQNSFSAKNHFDFSNTNINIVKSKMPHLDKCIFKKGFFPDTAEGIEDSFAFVSVDTDLYEPIYNGLKYFYPRLSKGGYIFVHDYNDAEYKGAKEAVQKYCSENDLNYFPLCDGWGSAIIIK